MLSFCCFTLEVGIADVHDGDASADEIAQVAGFTGLDGQADGSSDAPQQDSAPQHLHACHCSHAHGSLTVASGRLVDDVASRIRPVGTAALIPDAVDLDVQVRPPIA